jgi:hypothetical protein
MITHVVLFKLKDASQKSVEKAKDILMGMRGKIPMLRHLEVGLDVLHSERSFDIALITRFDSMEDLKAYQIHPIHLEVAKYINSVKEASIAVDYEL